MASRVDAFMWLYAGAWVAGMETAVELYGETTVPGPLPFWIVLVARVMQVGGLLAAFLGAFRLVRRTPTLAPPQASLGAFLDAERAMSAYFGDVLLHAKGAGLILSLGFAYALVLYVRVLQARADHAYFLTIILLMFAALALAWWLPTRRLMAEDRRLREAEDA